MSQKPSTILHDGGALDLDFDVNRQFIVQLSGDVSDITTSNPPAIGSAGVVFLQDADGGYTVSWPAGWTYSQGEPTIDAAPGAETFVRIGVGLDGGLTKAWPAPDMPRGRYSAEIARLQANGATAIADESRAKTDGSNMVNPVIPGVVTAKPTASSGPGFIAQIDDDGALQGPTFDSRRNSVSPAASDQLGAFRCMGMDSAGNLTTYAGFNAIILDPTDASEDGQGNLRSIVGGVSADRYHWHTGFWADGLTEQSAGSGNFTALFVNGTNISATYAPLASPALTGTPTAPTATLGTANTQVATTDFVAQAVAALINSAPGALDTLGELAAQMATDESAVASLTTTVGGKLTKSSNLSDLTDPAAARTNLSVYSTAQADTAFQPKDAELTALGGLVGAANRFPIFTGPGAAALAYLEAGTFVPTVNLASAGNSAVSYTAQTGNYYRIGDRVFCDFSLAFQIVIGTGSGNLEIGGLPFNLANTNAGGAVRNTSANLTFPAGATFLAVAALSTTKFGLAALGSNVARAFIGAAHITSGATVTVSGSFSFSA